MVLVSFVKTVRSKRRGGDWAQSELAEIYRVLHLLQNAGVSVGMDRGLTDKNDPWCVFFDPANENVFLHIARYGGDYVLVSEALDIRIKARDFKSATRQFEEAVGVTLKTNQERSRKVIAHPASQLMLSLAAIILLVKTKSTQAAESGDGQFWGSQDFDMPKLRAVLNRLQESAENPALVAAMISVIVLSSSSITELDISVLDSVEKRVAGGYEPKTAYVTETDNLDSAILISADGVQGYLEPQLVQKRGVERDGAEPGDTGELIVLAALESAVVSDAAMQPITDAASVSFEGKDALHVSSFGSSLINAAYPNSDSDALLSGQDGAVEQEGILSPQGNGAGSQLVASILDGLGDTVVYSTIRLDMTNEVDFSALITLAAASTTESAAVTFNVGEPKQIANSTGNGAGLADYGAEVTVGGPDVPSFSPPESVVPSFAIELIHLFEEVEVFMYSDTQMIVVDTDVRNVNGAELAFVADNTVEGYTISLIGSRELIEDYFQSMAA